MKKRRMTVMLTVLVLLLCSISCAAAGVDDVITRETARFGHVKREGTDATAYRVKGTSHGQVVDLSAWGLDGSLDYVHGMYYMAKVKKACTVSAADSEGGKVQVQKGEQVVVLYFPNRRRNAVCRLKSGRSVLIPPKNLKVLYYIYNSSSAYTDAQIEEWIAFRGITSKTNYIFVASKFNQHGWVMVRSEAGWVCKYVLNISTGAYTNGGLPNDCYLLNSCAIRTHYKNKKKIGTGISYASKAGGNQIHYGRKILFPSTHGCISMRRTDYNFVYWYLPYGTRVVLF